MILFHQGTTSFNLQHKNVHKAWLRAISKCYGSSIKDLNYIFQSDEELLVMNQEHLNHDTFTDIITFDNRDVEGPVEADIFISINRVKDNANSFSVPFETELQRVMAHGLLHLLGFGDKSEAEKKEMRIAEDKALELFKTL